METVLRVMYWAGEAHEIKRCQVLLEPGAHSGKSLENTFLLWPGLLRTLPVLEGELKKSVASMSVAKRGPVYVVLGRLSFPRPLSLPSGPLERAPTL